MNFTRTAVVSEPLPTPLSLKLSSFPQDLPALGLQMAWYFVLVLSHFSLVLIFCRKVLMDVNNFFYQILILSTSYHRTDISAALFLNEC